jgi:hypothetical protein
MMGPGGHILHRAASFADFGQHMGNYGMHQQQYGHRQSLSSAEGAHEYHGMPLQHHQHQHQPQQPPMHPHEQAHMIQRTPSLPQHTYYVTEQNNPGVATMNTNPHASTTSMPAQYHQMQPRQGVERLPLEIPYPSAPVLNTSIQSSPSSFSAASGRSPSTQDGFYTHTPAAQAATYALHTASPVEQQQQHHHHHQQQQQQPPQLVAYQNQMTPQPQVMTQPPPPPQQQQQQVVHSPPQPQQDHVHPPEQYQPPQAQAEEGWYAPYQPPVEVTTIHQIPTYGSTMYEPWGLKAEYEDSSIQMPSARIDSM